MFAFVSLQEPFGVLNWLFVRESSLPLSLLY